MKRFVFALCAFGLTLGAALWLMSADTAAQSGRKRQVNPPPSQSGARIESQDPPNNKQSDKPLSDNTPTTVGDDGTIKLDTTLVTIPVSVVDQGGRFVPFLNKRDFRVYEDGVEQEIENFESVETPFHVALVIDTSRSTQFRLEDIQDAAFSFIRELRPDDQVMIVSFDDRVTIHSEFTSDRERLRWAIYNTRTGGSTRLYDAVQETMARYMERVQGRKAMVLFTDGVDTSSRRATAQSTLDMVEESDTLVFPIRYDTEDSMRQQGPVINTPGGNWPPLGWPQPNPRTRRRWPLVQNAFPQWPGQWPGQGGQWPGQGGRWPRGGGQGADYTRAAQYLQNLADRSGGRLYYADTLSNVTRAFSQIAEELRHQYALSYYPTNSKKDGTYRAVKVRTTQSGLVVRGRTGYRAASETQAQSGGGEDDNNRPVLRKRQLAAQ